MTLGEKIRRARSRCGLSQEQLAEKMAVSRSAVAKWETDKGLPDVGNLKVLARLLSVSVDELLDDADPAEETVLRESYDLAAYGYGCDKMKKDRVVREKFPDAAIYPLLGRKEPSEMEWSSTHTPDCRSDPMGRGRKAEPSFYLMEKEERQFLLTVTDRFVEVRLLEQRLQGNAFTLDGWSFVRCNYEIGQ